MIAQTSVDFEGDPFSLLQFEEGLCHKCNRVKPSLCWVGGGVLFIQQWGWYVRQGYFRLGIDPDRSSNYLADVCPSRYHQDLRSLAAGYEKLTAYYNGSQEESDLAERDRIIAECEIARRTLSHNIESWVSA